MLSTFNGDKPLMNIFTLSTALLGQAVPGYNTIINYYHVIKVFVFNRGIPFKTNLTNVWYVENVHYVRALYSRKSWLLFHVLNNYKTTFV